MTFLNVLKTLPSEIWENTTGNKLSILLACLIPAWPFKILRRKLKYSERTCTMWLQTILNSNILFSR